MTVGNISLTAPQVLLGGAAAPVLRQGDIITDSQGVPAQSLRDKQLCLLSLLALKAKFPFGKLKSTERRSLAVVGGRGFPHVGKNPPGKRKPAAWRRPNAGPEPWPLAGLPQALWRAKAASGLLCGLAGSPPAR
jgi:hypothetical protein